MVRQFGKVLIVNLEGQSSRTMEIAPEILKKFIGGARLSAYLYSQFVKGDVPPIDPASPFFIMTGPLTGTLVILSGRHGSQEGHRLQVSGESRLWVDTGAGSYGAPATTGWSSRARLINLFICF
jgi:aldehyde:ferredoxin oxidoreductase